MAYNPQYYGGYYQPQNFYGNNGAAQDTFSQMKGQYQPQPQMQMQMPVQQVPIQTSSNDMIWVLGEVEATSYPVAPNNTVTLWDKNNPTIYIKSANAQGVPSMRILDFVERSQNTPKTAQNETFNLYGKFVTVEKFNEFQGKFDELQARFEEMTAPTVKTTKKKGDSE